MNWTDPTPAEARIREALEWERRELVPLEEMAAARCPAPVRAAVKSMSPALVLVRNRSARRLSFVERIFSRVAP